MTAVDSNEQSADAGRLDPAAVYRRFLDALNRQDLIEAEACVDPNQYRENCVGLTDGYPNWADAKTSVQTSWKGLPDLHSSYPTSPPGRTSRSPAAP